MHIRYPFLDLALVRYCLEIPPSLKQDLTSNKLVLRRVGALLHLPPPIVARRKRAAQYGSRFHYALDKLVRPAWRVGTAEGGAVAAGGLLRT